MAGDWIKMRIDLGEDPAVISISSDLELEEFAVVGRLHKLWGWFDRQSHDGTIKCVTSQWIDRYVARTGFAIALQKAGWLELNGNDASFPNFDKHNGRSAKTRAMGMNRQQAHRAKDASPSERDTNVTREEKKREAKAPSPLHLQIPTGLAALLRSYPAHRCNISASLVRWKAINPDDHLQTTMIEAAKLQAASSAWTADAGQRVPNLSRWLKNLGWRATHDETRAPSAQTAVIKVTTPAPMRTEEELREIKRRADEIRAQLRQRSALTKINSNTTTTRTT